MRSQRSVEKRRSVGRIGEIALTEAQDPANIVLVWSSRILASPASSQPLDYGRNRGASRSLFMDIRRDKKIISRRFGPHAFR